MTDSGTKRPAAEQFGRVVGVILAAAALLFVLTMLGVVLVAAIRWGFGL